MTVEKTRFVNSLRWASITLSEWAAEEFDNGASLEEVKHRIKRAMSLIEPAPLGADENIGSVKPD